MESPLPHLIIIADAPGALTSLFGISLLERLLRTLQRCGFREGVILTNSREVKDHLATPSWARSNLSLTFQNQKGAMVSVQDIPVEPDRVLLVSGDYYYDSRLLDALTRQNSTAVLVDSAPPSQCVSLWRNESELIGAAALLHRGWLAQQDPASAVFDRLVADSGLGTIQGCDAATIPTYMADLRKDVRSVFFPLPSRDLLPVAEGFVRNRAQNGILDIPGQLDSPIEDWIVARICHTTITPNQVTLITILIGVAVTILFATGHLWWGILLAYAIEVLDGVDGKLARTKVETTAAGNLEHAFDFLIQVSWWSALAFHFEKEGLRSAYVLLLLLVGSDLLGQLARRLVRTVTGRSLDDSSSFDRFMRRIGARRNINIWILAGALLLGQAKNGFVLICWWAVATAAVQFIRALQIWTNRDTPNGRSEMA